MSGDVVTRDPIDVGALLAELRDDGRGATAVFLGSVRSGPDDGPVTAIEYSAYEAMVGEEFGRIVAEAAGRWPGTAYRVRHRVGRVSAGDPSIAVAASAPHRAEAFEACRYVIEEAKQRLPVWKREILADGTTRWREG
jgi:molybdopterin synthase catalytic subunit